MAVFHELVTLVNRAPVPLTIRFDGQESTIQPGDNQVPKIVIPYAKNQNPIMGSADAANPTLSGARYLVGVKGTKDNCTPLTKVEWETHTGRPSRMDTSFITNTLNPKKERMIVGGKNKSTHATAFDAREQMTNEFGARD